MVRLKNTEPRFDITTSFLAYVGGPTLSPPAAQRRAFFFCLVFSFLLTLVGPLRGGASKSGSSWKSSESRTPTEDTAITDGAPASTLALN